MFVWAIKKDKNIITVKSMCKKVNYILKERQKIRWRSNKKTKNEILRFFFFKNLNKYKVNLGNNFFFFGKL